jgi:hypothetical protein
VIKLDGGQGVEIDGMSLRGKLRLDIVDREILFAQSHDQIPDRIACWCSLGAMANVAEKPLLEVFGVAELVTQHPKSTGGIAETASRFSRGWAFDDIGPEGLVLAMQGIDRFEEKAGLA